MDMNWITFLGLLFNTAGSILLAVSLSQTIKSLDTSVTALEHFKDTFLSKGGIVSFEGLDKHRKNAKRSDRRKMVWGLILLIVGFVLQLLPILNGIINKI